MSDNIIFYFSGTGNSLAAAKAVAKTLGNTQVISMRCDPQNIDTSNVKRIGFVSPVYFQGLPNRVETFVKGVSIKNDAYIFSVVTCASKIVTGNTINRLYRLMKQKGHQLDYACKYQTVGNYIVAYARYQKAEKVYSQSNKELQNYANDIKAYRTKRVPPINPIFVLSHMQLYFWRKKISGFHVNDKCTGCGLCKAICPVRNIKILDKKPVFDNHCEQCVGCIHGCPVNAINYKYVTQNRVRYFHPDVKPTDLIQNEITM